MRDNKTKARLRASLPVIGTFAFFGDLAVVEIVGSAGFDFVIIDAEHSPRDLGRVQEMVRAADAVVLTPLGARGTCTVTRAARYDRNRLPSPSTSMPATASSSSSA